MKVAMISKNPKITDYYKLPTDYLINLTGNNTGNLAFIHAVVSHLNAEMDWFDWDFDPLYVNAHYDFALLICANMISTEIVLDNLADNIEKIEIPMSAVSLGVQAKLGAEELSIPENNIRFLRILSDKSISFGIRGLRAASFLDKIGIKNYRLIGCPSNFINLNPNLGKESLNSLGKIRDVAVQYDGVMDPRQSIIEEHMIALNKGVNAKIFLQSPLLPETDFSRKTHHVQFTEQEIEYLCCHFGYDGNIEPEYFVRDFLRIYFSVDQWLDDMRFYDFSVGMRLHGNILALQAGIPSLIIFHDARVEELSETLMIPSISLETFLKTPSYQYMADHYLGKLEKYDENRLSLAKEYYKLLEENHLPVVQALKGFVKI